ncbi:NAD-dependent protein deacetylase sirtuin-3-like isoform X1 [Argonauta hians]
MDSNGSSSEVSQNDSSASGTGSPDQSHLLADIESTLLATLKNLTVQDVSPEPVRNQNRKLSSSPAGSSDHKLDPWTRITKIFNNKDLSNVVVLVGAGLSTNSGIMDFRTPGTGLYDNLQQYKIPYPEAIFDIDYFRHNPKPFFALAKELYPSVKYRPNYNHYFLRLLQEKGLLLRLYTQNIDGLERLSGIPCSKLIECHGTFSHATCLGCRKKYKGNDVKNAIFKEDIPKCKSCEGVIKPDIVFFGEDLPQSFYQYQKDMSKADLVLIMGTSLEVHPFAGIIDFVPKTVPRVLFNMEAVGPFRMHPRKKDFTIKGDLTESLEKVVTRLSWQSEMLEILKEAEGKKYANRFHKEWQESNHSHSIEESNPTEKIEEQNGCDDSMLNNDNKNVELISNKNRPKSGGSTIKDQSSTDDQGNVAPPKENGGSDSTK